MSSGVSVADACKAEYLNLKQKKCYRYIVLGLTEKLDVVEVKKTAPTTATYDDFLADMKEVEDAQQCRYVIYDVPFELRGCSNTKLVFITWSPDTAAIKQKMLYSSSKGAVKLALGDGIYANVQANDFDDMAEEALKKLVMKQN